MKIIPLFHGNIPALAAGPGGDLNIRQRRIFAQVPIAAASLKERSGILNAVPVKVGRIYICPNIARECVENAVDRKKRGVAGLNDFSGGIDGDDGNQIGAV